MKLHANARPCPKGRELLVDRVEEQGWSLTEAAEAAGVSERTARKWLAPLPRRRARPGLLDRCSAPRRGRRTARRAAGRGDRGAAAAADDRRRDRRGARDGALDGLGDPDADRARQARPPRPASRRTATSASGPGELIHIDVKKLGRIRAAPGIASPATGRHDRRRTDAARQRTQQVGWEFVHVCVDDATRLAYVEVLPDEKAHHRDRLPPPGRRALRLLRDHGRAADHRQRHRPTARRIHALACRALGSATCAPGPTARRPTARPSASSARCSAAGPTARSTATAPNAPPPSPAGSTSTITDDHTAPSATSRPSLASTS